MTADRRVVPPLRVAVALALAFTAGLAAWLLLRDTEDAPRARVAPAVVHARPEIVSPAALRDRAARARQPVYWAGSIPGRTLEVTENPGQFYVRYLPRKASAGVQKPYLTVATYQVRNAFDVTRAVSRRSGSVTIPIGDGAVAFYAREQPASVYLAHSGSPYQIEVFDPRPRVARELVASGRVQPVPAAP